MTSRFTANGKQLLLDNRHLADCANEGVACALAIVAERALLVMLSHEEEATIRKVFG